MRINENVSQARALMFRFRRITTQNCFIPQVDGLRFIAIAWVVLMHIYAALEDHGAVAAPYVLDSDLPKRGVELFFAISGFILGVPFASARLLNAEKVDLKRYFLRRLTRLEPPYILSLFVWAASQWITAHRSFGNMLPHLLASCVYIHNLAFGGFKGAVNGVAWSLEIEIQFYILAPTLACMFVIRRPGIRRSLILLLMAAAGVLSLPLYRSTHLHYSIAYYLGFFLAGFLVCDLYVTQKNWNQSYWWDALAACGWPLIALLGRSLGHVLLPFAIVALYLSAFRGRICSVVFSNRLLTTIGGMCYSIYLFHFLAIYAVKHISMPVHFGNNFWLYYAVQSCAILPFVLVFCGGFFLVIERPCMDRLWPQKLWRFAQSRIPQLKEDSRVSRDNAAVDLVSS